MGWTSTGSRWRQRQESWKVKDSEWGLLSGRKPPNVRSQSSGSRGLWGSGDVVLAVEWNRIREEAAHYNNRAFTFFLIYKSWQRIKTGRPSMQLACSQTFSLWNANFYTIGENVNINMCSTSFMCVSPSAWQWRNYLQHPVFYLARHY